MTYLQLKIIVVSILVGMLVFAFIAWLAGYDYPAERGIATVLVYSLIFIGGGLGFIAGIAIVDEFFGE